MAGVGEVMGDGGRGVGRAGIGRSEGVAKMMKNGHGGVGGVVSGRAGMKRKGGK